MSVALHTAPTPPATSRWIARLAWAAIAVATLAFAQLPRGALPGLWKEVPGRLEIPLASWISTFVDWLVGSASFGLFTFQDLTRWLAAILDAPAPGAPPPPGAPPAPTGGSDQGPLGLY